MFEPSAVTIDRNATVAPKAATAAPKPNRSRAKLARRLDQRTAQYRRIVELAAIFTAAKGDEALSPMMQLKIAEAAELKAIAEAASAAYLRDASGTLDDLVRVTRRADLSIRRLGIVEGKPAPVSPLADYLAHLAAKDASESAESPSTPEPPPIPPQPEPAAHGPLRDSSDGGVE
jgi:hypothetical protein